LAGGATPTSSAGHASAGANTTSKLTFKSDHQSGAGQGADGPAQATTPVTEPPRAPETGTPKAEIEHAVEETLEKRASIGSRIIGAIAKRFSSLIVAIADFIAPAPPPTRDQAERMERAVEERQQDHAAAAQQQEKDERLTEILQQIARDDAQREESLAQRYGFRPIIRPVQREHDREDDGGRERERDRGYEME